MDLFLSLLYEFLIPSTLLVVRTTEHDERWKRASDHDFLVARIHFAVLFHLDVQTIVSPNIIRAHTRGKNALNGEREYGERVKSGNGRSSDFGPTVD